MQVVFLSGSPQLQKGRERVQLPPCRSRGFQRVARLLSADLKLNRAPGATFYDGRPLGKSVITVVYPVNKNTQFGHVEIDYHFW